MGKKIDMSKRLYGDQSKRVNAFIKDHAHEEDNWASLTDRVNRKFGTSLQFNAVKDRGLRLKVSVKGIALNAFSNGGIAMVKTGDVVKDGVINLVRRRKNLMTVEQLADALDVAPSKVRVAMEELKASHHNITIIEGHVELEKQIAKAPPMKIDIRKTKGRTFKFGFTTDNHLGSKYERLDVLETLFDIYADEGITSVYQAGNMIEGDSHFNKQDRLASGIQGQCQYFAEKWPKRKGIKTYYVTGDDHEGWYVQREGVNIGRYLQSVCEENGRKDLVYLGHMEHDIIFTGKNNKKSSVMRIIHAGGGSAYATSYSAQKIVESYQGGEKPNVLLIGHYHKAEYGYPREVHCVQGGCTMDQSPFMRKNKIQAHVGGWIIEMTLNDDGVITRFSPTWIPFYDRGFYDKAWNYKLAA